MPVRDNLALQHTDPVSALAEFEQVLASNCGEDCFDIAVKLLAAKLMDEKTAQEPGAVQFKLQPSIDQTFAAVSALYREAAARWPSIDTNGGTLTVEPAHLVLAMRPLLGWSIVRTDLTCLDATLERLVARDAKGRLGQYFTPRDIIRFCVDVIRPDGIDRIIDPACGSGGFLFEASHYAAQSSREFPACLGIDFSSRAIKVATLLAAAHDNGRITVSFANSLDGRAYRDTAPAEWSGFFSSHSGSESAIAREWGAWNRLGATVVMTNPPFAGEVDDPAVVSAYESNSSAARRRAATRESLFLERAVNLLEPGGRMAIVLPQGMMANSSASYVRRWLLQKCRLVGVIGLHPYAFLPYTAVKTSILFAYKPRMGAALPASYDIFFAVSKESGKDSSGRRIRTNDYAEIGRRFHQYLRQQELPWAGAAEASNTAQAMDDTVPLSEVVHADRVDAEFFDPNARAFLKQFDSKSSMRIANMVSSRVDRFKRTRFREIEYLDISSVDAKTGLASPAVIAANQAPSRAAYLVQPGDVLVSTVRPERNVVALVSDGSAAPRIASNGFCVLRPQSIRPEALFAYCKTDAFKQFLSRHATASMYPAVSEKDVLSMPVKRVSQDLEDRVADLISSGLSKIQEAQREIQTAISLLNQQAGSPLIRTPTVEETEP